MTAPTTTDRRPGPGRAARAGVRAGIAAALVRRAARRLPFTVEYPGGHRRGALGDAPVLRLHRPRDFFARLGRDGLIGFGESYQAGDWDSDDLAGLLTVFAADAAGIVPAPFQRLRRLFVAAMPNNQDNTRANAAANVHAHYDLSNNLFALFLDPTMSYSSGLFAPGDTDLTAAQIRKIDRLLDRTGVGPGTRLLEIGTGWGELALRAARRGATVHTITLAEEQRRHAAEKIAAAGEAGRVTVERRDYRDLPAGVRYDAVVSVEMVEAVGERYWPEYFATLDRVLAPGGRIGLQAITMADDRLAATRRTYTWVQKYIFPGGLIPSIPAIERVLAAATTLEITDDLAFGADYAATLRRWRENFAARAGDLPGLGFDEVFTRTWELYLAYSQAGFAAGYLDVHQLVLGRKP